MQHFHFSPLRDPDPTPGGGAPPGTGAPPEQVIDVPWTEFSAKYADPAKLEPYKAAKTWSDVYNLQGQRLAEAQTALRTRPAPLPERPAADAPPEAVSAWRAAHGLPDTPEGYGLTKPEDVPDEQWRPADAEAFAKWAHEEGLSPTLVKKLQGFDADRQKSWAGEIQQQQAQEKQAMQAAESAELAKRFGANVDPVIKELQEFAQSRPGGNPDIFNPASEKFWGVEFVALAHDWMGLIKRGEDKTTRNMGAPANLGAYDKTWAKGALHQGHPDYEALTNTGHPRHADIKAKHDAAYAAG